MQEEPQSDSINLKLMGDIAGVLGKRDLKIDFPRGANVGQLLRSLCDDYGEAFSKEVFNASGGLLPTLLIFVNGREIKELQGLATPVTGDKIEIIVLPIFEGG